jgi:GDP-L-fucose synthase
MPTNLYGPGDNYHPENSHVVPALIRRFHESKQNGVPIVKVWGTGKPLREFLFVDDLADACVFVLEHYSDEQHVNVGSGEEATIAEFAQLVADVVGYRGELTFDPSRPDGGASSSTAQARRHGMAGADLAASRPEQASALLAGTIARSEAVCQPSSRSRHKR